MTIKYVIGDCFLGKLLVSYSPVGVCHIAFADTQEELQQYMFHAYSGLAQVTDLSDPIYKRVLKFLADTSQEPEFQLHIVGTDFQRRVWQEIQKVPVGQTTTYKRIALALGMPKASRAVAKACASTESL